ncbi:MAG: SprT family zinc-dependent metalloprotease [Erythrobacter sp.]|jgi:predicted metal-dependent hydrolase|uniref:M48 family metallopeptidase n=1 Tax=Erythrobacter sp. TaxID=1042 RepID=UPI002B4736C1|nr:SprT family zinc-dependent metalloprotease [Erythrobacter sp.]WRH71894.1 MAG: SprT family zinc-dependent metalloprotease [Erythrobacter sp.]
MIDWLRRPPLEPELELAGQTVPIVLRRMRHARRLTLRLAPDGSEVRISLPAWAEAREAIAFAHARADWLAQQLARLPARAAPVPGGAVHYRGAALRLEWEARAPRRPALADEALRLGGPEAGLETRLRRWLEAEALRLCEDDMRDYCAAAGLDPVPVGLTRAQRRWGSCSDKSRIRINWRLVQAPDFVRRSVVAHEVAHLVHFDHSPAFHALLGRIYEGDIRSADQWLREHGRGLYASFG